jgi:hypothetical protein
MHSHVLQLDLQGVPHAWISLEQAALHYATGSVIWEEGEGPLAVLRGGHNTSTGRQSLLAVHPIIAVRGHARVNLFDVPIGVTKDKLLRRDRQTCAYCGEVYEPRDLQAEHIVPESRGGAYSWMNLVAACGACNLRKANRTPDEAGMPLLYLPYVPSRWEGFLLDGRRIRADVHDWLTARLPKHSRLH